MKILHILSIMFFTTTVCFPVLASIPATNNQNQSNMMTSNMSLPSNTKDDEKKMSEMMNAMQTMKIQMMGHKMMMMGMKMKMMGEVMSKSDNSDTKNQGIQLIQLGEQVFNMGNKMNPNPLPMGKDNKKCPMCEKMMQMNDNDD